MIRLPVGSFSRRKFSPEWNRTGGVRRSTSRTSPGRLALRICVLQRAPSSDQWPETLAVFVAQDLFQESDVVVIGRARFGAGVHHREVLREHPLVLGGHDAEPRSFDLAPAIAVEVAGHTGIDAGDDLPTA